MLVGYCRVSTASREQLSSLNLQRSRLTRNGCNFILQDIDSGLNCERVNYQQLKALIRSRSVSAILVTSSSRLGRDARECDDFISLCDRFDVSCNALDKARLSMITAEDMLIIRLTRIKPCAPA
ncbi:MAG: recombinase family protein, partial [Aphanocapsa feldmannii 288cV]